MVYAFGVETILICDWSLTKFLDGKKPTASERAMPIEYAAMKPQVREAKFNFEVERSPTHW
jgi:hypothetical protein